jgi:hypothetical protein
MALLRGEEQPEVRFVPLSADLQESLATEFHGQAEAFLGETADPVPYSPGYHPDEDEVIRIESFDLSSSLVTALKTPDVTPNLEEDEIESGAVKALVGIVPRPKSGLPDCLFQTFDARQILRRNRVLMFRRDQFNAVEGAGLQIGSHLAALYRDGTLYFQSEETVRRFLDLDSYFREATDQELSAFAKLPLWDSSQQSQLILTPDRWLRRKITSISQRGVLDGLTPRTLQTLAKQFQMEVQVIRQSGKDRVQLPSDKKQLKMFIRLLAEDLFKSVISGDRFLASSKRPLT